ncbi:histone deacetylase family protein [Mesorhizobium sp. M4A.F.Ca.ET.022.05.2.1]|uniref:histone deacetylase family protein n=1 Tax=Mesorhizobium sp. M4A.F.Ca.ET.022.05.2.1 TaxID=2496653 RepID=UPI000FCB4871|nr:histone deacetylase family protein [Mesorhizobium sp. M4A.F.Ca.ET.022.05.2.1]RVC81679.1 histone deacetylase family protein [Mesorhizobium sp. M4A.F.Ca.ET.022.05.2.1]
MRAVVSPLQRGYKSAPVFFRGKLVESQDTPERLEAFIAVVREMGADLIEPPVIADALLKVVHDPGYLEFLAEAPGRWPDMMPGLTSLMPNIYPTRHFPARRPPHYLGQAGYYLGDMVSPLTAQTWGAALGSASSAAHAASLVLAGEPVAYALCRPSGHHAHADMGQGFCFLNNAAIAATVARTRHARVAVIDIDVHHGNGTQHIFYDRDDVFFASLHSDPDMTYPFFVGHADEVGTGRGEGFNLNLPLKVGSGDAAYLAALDIAIERIRRFDPGLLVVSLGLDAHESDLLGSLNVTSEGFVEVARRLAALRLPTVLVQEGGYTVSEVGHVLRSVLSVFPATVKQG